MRILADSHVLVWWLDDPQRLIAPPLYHALQDPANDVLFSAASVWELSLKSAKGQLRLPATFVTLLKADGFDELPVTARHAISTSSLPSLHGDPFDRILIAQALVEGLVLATRDRTIMRYDVPVLDA